eukprot:TRINITY_DN4116_c0_g1_i1.p1 TRINITY_DN4116_c0_g1~~TRINITY_DN4116_c0_g1_i1.p1  ORF type:complete len:587 (-),score=166.38 TRINITY_DN4116_c0_g1_i1:130-1737(-)
MSSPSQNISSSLSNNNNKEFTQLRQRSMSTSPIIKQGTLELVDKLGRPIGKCRISLTKNSFRWNPTIGKNNDQNGLCAPTTDLPHNFNDDFHVFIRDILSVSEPNDKKQFCVNAYPWETTEFTKRYQKVIRVKCSSEEEKTEWIEAINKLLRPKSTFSEDNKRQITVLINPFGGKKQAPIIWKQVEPMFSLVPINLRVKETEYAGHAEELAKSMELNDCDGIVTVSGDGLLFEVVQGLMARDDVDEAVQKIAIGIIPGGSGNGLSSTWVSTNLDPVASAFNICKELIRPLDLMKVYQPNIEPKYCFLTVNWGLISDVDFESETFRFMGGARFTFSAIFRIADLRFYSGKIYYIPSDDQEKVFCPKRKAICPKCVNLTKKNNLILSDNYIPVSDQDESIFEPLMNNQNNNNNNDNNNWEVLEGEFITVVAMNASHLSYDTHFAPYAHLSDGNIDLVVIKKCTRSKLLSMFTSLETGEFVNSSFFNNDDNVFYRKVKAFRLEPITTDTGCFDLDGERGESYDPLNCMLIPSALNFMG